MRAVYASDGAVVGPVERFHAERRIGRLNRLPSPGIDDVHLRLAFRVAAQERDPGAVRRQSRRGIRGAARHPPRRAFGQVDAPQLADGAIGGQIRTRCREDRERCRPGRCPAGRPRRASRCLRRARSLRRERARVADQPRVLLRDRVDGGSGDLGGELADVVELAGRLAARLRSRRGWRARAASR